MLKAKEKRVAILGVAIDNVTMDEVLETVEAQIEEGGFHQIATANADFLIKSINDEELCEVLCRCDLVLADGMPLVWASSLMGSGLRERVTGADLVPQLAALSARRGYRIFLLGAEEDSSAGTAAAMESNYPGLCIAGRYSPEHKQLEEMDHEEILSRIEAARPDILLVAFGNPKQEKWLAMHRHQLTVPVCIGVGGSFDFMSGRIRRAPEWMKRSGMEWFYRMMQEPSRMFIRYAGNAVGLLRHLPLQVAALAMQTKRRRPAQIANRFAGTVSILHIEGDFTGEIVQRFERDVRSAIVSGSHMVLDMSTTALIGADALGSIIYATKIARKWKRELWIAGVHGVQHWILRSAKLRPFFRMAPTVAEALRRIEPDLLPNVQIGRGLPLFNIGSQLIPLHAPQVPQAYRRALQLLNQAPIGTDELVPTAMRSGGESSNRASEIHSFGPDLQTVRTQAQG